MSFISTGGGPANWSAITIDVDKDMGGKGLSNLKQVAAAMVGGDLIAKGLGGILVRIPAGIANTVLTSQGAGMLPTWAPGGLYLNRYYPSNLTSTIWVNVVAASQFISKNVALGTALKYAYADDPTDLIKQLTPALVSTNALTIIAAADQSVAKNAPITKKYDLIIVVSGAEAYVHTGSYTDETTAAQNATANDMTLLPAVPAQNDAYYFGFDKLFDVMTLNIGTPGVGVWTITWEYWNGAWTALSGVTDGTTGFTAASGSHDVSFTRPGDWATTVVNAITKYWIRARVSAYTSITTQPKGTQSWIKIIT